LFLTHDICPSESSNLQTTRIVLKIDPTPLVSI
jgi:hypothetical protein